MNKIDKRSITSALNGKKGGRKKGEATLIAERVKAKIAEMIEKNHVPLIQKQIDKAIEGDTGAFRELFDRAFGKAPQSINGGEDEHGNIIPLLQNVLRNNSTP